LTAYLAEKFTSKGSLRAETSIDGGVIGNQVWQLIRVSFALLKAIIRKQLLSWFCMLPTLHPLVTQRSAFTLQIEMFWSSFCGGNLAMCRDAAFVAGVGDNHHAINLGPINAALGDKKAAAMPAFQTLSGAVVTGSFSGKAKVSCSKAFSEASDDT